MRIVINLMALLMVVGCAGTTTPKAPPPPSSQAPTTTAAAGLVYEVYGAADTAAFIELANGTESFFSEEVPLPWRFPSKDLVDDVAIFTARADIYGSLTCKVSRDGRVLVADTVVFGPGDVTIPFANCSI